MALLDRWLRSKKPGGKIRSKHLLAWLVSMLAFAVASVALWAGAAFGWDIATFRVFYLFGAILSVPPLGLGTLYLLSSEKTADRCAIAVAVASVFAIGVLTAAPTTGRLSAIGLPNGADVFTALPRLLAAIASIAGSLVVIGGAIWTLQQSKKKQAAQQLASQPATSQPAPRQVTPRIKAGISLIALGTIILGLGGASNSVAEEMTAFALALAVGAAFLFTGFLLSTTPKPPPNP